MESMPAPDDTAAEVSPAIVAPALPSRLWHPTLIVFVASACSMTLELVAGRIIAPYVGVSLYTWTSVIGVVLAGMSAGNYLGGRLADRWASPRLLGLVFLVGGLACFIILGVDVLGDRTPGDWHIVVRILALTGALFLLPSLVLGAVSPVVVKLAVSDLARTGSTVGRIYATSTVGSIIGTFATGFFLISWFGTHTIVLAVALVLIVVGLLLALRGRLALVALAMVPVVAGSVVAWRAVSPGRPCTRETNYFCIKVREETRNGDPVRVLILDRLVHSYSSLTDPTQLVYGYEKVYAEATAYMAQQRQLLKVAYIGGGGYTFPRYVEAVYPGTVQHVVEIDPGVTQTAYDMLGLAPDTAVVTYNEDARLFFSDQSVADRYDIVYGDAFNDFSVPYHLTTIEFDRQVKARLEPGGIYMVNMIDGAGGSFVRAYTRTLQRVFAHVYLMPTTGEQWRHSPRTTFVLIASDEPLDIAAFEGIDAGDGDPLLYRVAIDQEEMQGFLAEGRQVLLTDSYAPVDQMLAAVVRDEIPAYARVTPTPTYVTP
ncbi:MAG: fused MFS/spermidine synthase [Anaerolineae bacterium]